MNDGSSDDGLDIHPVIRSIHRALIDSESPATLESAVCEVFAESGPYVAAWFGSLDSDAGHIHLQTAAAVDSTALQNGASVSYETDLSTAPTAKAVSTGTVQVVSESSEEVSSEIWQQETIAVIPIVNDDVEFDFLTLYADRTGAFDERERQVLEELGKTLATAISGVQARQKLTAQKEKYERFTTRISEAYYAVDDEWRITYWNDQMAARTGIQATELRGTPLWEAFPSIEGTELETAYREAMAENEYRSIEHRLDDPFDYWVEIDIYPDEDGLSIFSREITERKEREHEQMATTAILETIVENLPSGILVEDADRTILTANEQLCSVLSLPVDCTEIIGQDCDVAARQMKDLFADPEEFIEGIDERIDSREPVRGEEIRLADGRILERDYVPYELFGSQANMWLYRDVTDRRERERDLERSRRIIESSTDIATIVDQEGTITYVSPAIERVLGYEPSELVGRDGFNFQSRETSELVRAAIEAVIEQPEKARTVQTKFRHADGSWVWVESTMRNHLDDEIIDGILVSSRDITERKAYQQRIEEQRDNLETLNQVVRHDIRNDLQLVTAYADILSQRIDPDSEEHGYLETLRDRSEQAVNLTLTAGDIARVMLGDGTVVQPVLLSDCVMNEIRDVRSAHPGAEIEVDGEIPPVTVEANDMLGSVFRNLLNNAIQHNDKSTPAVTVAATDRGDTVEVSIADNGPGVPESQRSDIFGKGTRGLDSSGTGLGLHLVRTLTDRYGGDVWLRDENSTGAVFVVELQKHREDT